MRRSRHGFSIRPGASFWSRIAVSFNTGPPTGQRSAGTGAAGTNPVGLAPAVRWGQELDADDAEPPPVRNGQPACTSASWRHLIQPPRSDGGVRLSVTTSAPR